MCIHLGGTVNKIRSYFRNHFFDRELPFQYRLSAIFFIESFVLAFLSFIVNFGLGTSTLGVVAGILVNLICIAFFIVPLKVKRKVLAPLLLGMVFIYTPLMFVQYGGYDGSVLFFALSGAFMLAFIYRGKTRVFMVLLNIAIYLALIYVQFNNPELIAPMAGPEERVFDLVFALCFTFTAMFVIARYVDKAYEGERLSNVYLLHEVESKNNELEQLSVLDALTGTYNRRWLTEALASILERSKREKSMACAIMFDVDHFKSINDTYGHSIGDQVLVAIVNAAQTQLRKNDTLARYGGEEFLVLIYPDKLDDAVRVAHRIREAVEKIDSIEDLKVTVSLGVIQSQPNDTPDSFLTRVDEYLYKAKESGRNRVEHEVIVS